MSEEEIAAVFFVSVQVVKQRLKLACVSPKLLDLYAEDGMTLDQLIAFTVNPVVLEQWPALDGHYPIIAYQYAFGLSLAFQAAALVWFAMPWLGTLRKYLSRSIARPTGEYDNRTGLVLAADEGLLEAHGQVEW